MTKVQILIIGATGRQGFQVCGELSKTDKFTIFGTSRTASNAKLESIGVTTIPFIYGDKKSIAAALDQSNAKLVYFVTDLLEIAKGNVQTEIDHGKIIIDSCKDHNVKFIVFASVDGADSGHPKARHITSKLPIESYLKQSGIPHAILSPPSFFESMDDARFRNPLVKGSVKSLYDSKVKVPQVATVDIAKAAVAMFLSPERWNGKTLMCVSTLISCDEVAQILTKLSGVPCKASLPLPKFLQYFLIPDLYYMTLYYEENAHNPEFIARYENAIKEFKKVVPDALDVESWLVKKGQWANGEKFGASTVVKSSPPIALYASVAIAALAAAAGYFVYTNKK